MLRTPVAEEVVSEYLISNRHISRFFFTNLGAYLVEYGTYYIILLNVGNLKYFHSIIFQCIIFIKGYCDHSDVEINWKLIKQKKKCVTIKVKFDISIENLYI